MDSFNNHPVIASDGKIIAITHAGSIIVLDPNDGSVVTTSTVPDRRVNELFSGSPNLGSDGTLYIGSYLDPPSADASSPALRALNPDFSLKWERDFSNGALMSPSYLQTAFLSPAIGSDGTVYIGTLGKVYALDPNNGSDIWVYNTGGSQICTTPAVAPNGTVYVTAYDYCLHAINPGGSQKWKNCSGTFSYGSPSVGPTGTVYAANGDNLGAFNPSNGSTTWNFNVYSGYSSTAVVASDGTIYYHSFGANKLYAINPNGTLKWERSAGRGPMSSSPSIANDGTVYAPSDGYGLYAFQ